MLPRLSYVRLGLDELRISRQTIAAHLRSTVVSGKGVVPVGHEQKSRHRRLRCSSGIHVLLERWRTEDLRLPIGVVNWRACTVHNNLRGTSLVRLSPGGSHRPNLRDEGCAPE